MKAAAVLLSLAGVVVSAAVPQQPLMLGNNSMEDRYAAYEGRILTFKSSVPSTPSQCATIEIEWTRTVGPYRLIISIKFGGPRQGAPEVIEDINSTSHPVVIRGRAGGLLLVDVADATGNITMMARRIFPSSDASCLE